MNRTEINREIMKQISRYQSPNYKVAVHGVEQFADGYLVKFYREYAGLNGQCRSEDRVAFFVVTVVDVRLMWDMIARTN